MSDRNEAEEALYSAIAQGAKSASSPEGIKKVAEAFSEVVHGPQGGGWESHVRNENRQETDYHETSHQGEDRKRPQPGFGNGA